MENINDNKENFVEIEVKNNRIIENNKPQEEKRIAQLEENY